MHIVLAKLNHLHLERTLFWIELVLVCVLAVAYGYCIVRSVINVTLRQELTVSIQETEARIGTLENTYLERSADLSEGHALAYGLVALTPKAYVRVGTGERLTRRP